MIPAASQATALPENVASSALTKKSGVMTDYEKKIIKSLVNSAYLLRSAFVVFTRVRSLSDHDKFTYHMKGIWFGRRLHTCSLSENIHSNKKYAHFRFRIQNPRTREQTRTTLFRINASVFKRQVPKISRRTKNKILFTETYPLGM